MDYKEKLKTIINSSSTTFVDIDIFLKYFPELKESEDEKIRKELIFYLRYQHSISENFEDIGKWIAWLEKQGHEPNWCHHKVDLSNCSEEYRKAYYDGWNNCNMQHSQCKSESNDVVKCLINGMKFYYEDNTEATWGTEKFSMKVKDILAWLEKQGEQKSKKVSLWKHWKDGIAGNGEGKIIYLVKMDNTYKLTSCLGFECDYIELSELDKLLSEKQGEQKPVDKVDQHSIPVSDNSSLPTLDESIYHPCTKEVYEQKSDSNVLLTWSEEEEKMLHCLEEIVSEYWTKAEYEKNEIKIKEASNISYFLKTIQKHPLCWFKCSYALPNQDGVYLVVTDGLHNDVYDMARYDCIEGWHKASKILYWMPIPQLNDKSIIEQKSADKVELKFHEGDWVVSPNGVYWHIDKISNNRYEVTSNTGESSDCWNLDTNIYHKFTIQDAKDGNVLSYRDGQWIFIYKNYVDDNSFQYYALYSTIHQDLTINDAGFTLLGDAIVPATKEQRDLLFSKMKEAGYEWDAEHKQLNKIEKSSAWSKEDDNCLSTIIAEFSKCAGKSVSKDEWMRCNDFLNSLRDRVQSPSKQEWSEEDEKILNNLISSLARIGASTRTDSTSINYTFSKEIDWLKSLRGRYTISNR